VKTIEVALPDGTKAEMEYKVITEGSGATRRATTPFRLTTKARSSMARNSTARLSAAAAKFQVNRVVKGWTEASSA